VEPAEELHHRGVAALDARRYDAARRLFDRAARTSTSPVLLARIDASRAYLAYETGDPEGAFVLCKSALSRPGLDQETKGIIECQHALLLQRSGRTTESLKAFGDAIDRLRDPVELAKAYINRGGVYLQVGQADRAIADFDQAVRRARAGGAQTEATFALHNLGYAHMLRGDLVRSLNQFDEVRGLLANMSPLVRATIEQDRAEALIAAGLVREGAAALREAARVFGLRRMHQRRGEAELALARTLQFTHPTAALAAAREARRRFVRTGTDAWRVRADGVALAAEVELGRKGPSLLTRGETLIEELTEQGLYWGATSVRLHTARVMVRRGDYEGARQRLAKVRVDDSAPLAVRLLARDVRAELASRLGRKQAALMHLRTGLGDLHSWQSSFGSLDLQTMVAGHGTRLAVRGLGLAVESRSPEILLEWSERARMLASRPTTRSPPAWPSCAGSRPLRTDRGSRHRAATPSYASRCASAPGSTAAPVRSPNPARWTRCRPRCRPTPHWSPTSSATARWSRSWSPTPARSSTTWGSARRWSGCSGAYCPTWMSRPPRCRPAWPGPSVASSPRASTTSAGCWSRRCSAPLATGGWC